MRLILVRHGEPDYSTDTLSEKGKADAILTAQRVKNWDVKQFYVSPLGRAKETIAPTLETTGREAITLDWAREFSYRTINPVNGKDGVCWDYVPSHWTNDSLMFDINNWPDASGNNSNPILREKAEEVITGLDKLLEEYGLFRKDNYYININRQERYVKSTVINMNRHYANELPPEDAGDTIVIFCHFGVTCLMLSHLLNIPFPVLTHGTIIPTCGITILNTEEHWGKESFFRIQALGDVSHLLNAGVPISSAGSFAPFFQM